MSCIHRGERRGDGYACASDRLVKASGAVPESLCQEGVCPYFNVPRLNSRGLGDTVHKITHALGIDTIVHTVVGEDCGCGERKEWLNNLLPYQQAPVTREVCPPLEPGPLPFPGGPVRNLMMYIYPISQFEVWRWNVEQIRKRLHLFNGKRIITIATDHATNTVEEVQEAFCGERIDQWIVGENDPTRWEMLGLPSMMSAVHSCDPNEMTFYCHAKGVQGPAHISDPHFREQPRVKWATCMYESCLDGIHLVEKALVDHTFAGSFKARIIHGQEPFRSSWHYSGTFYWFRNAKLFSLPNWNVFDQQWYGAETYPGQLVGWGQAAGLFCDHRPVLYLQDSWVNQVDAMWAEWKAKNLCTPASATS